MIQVAELTKILEERARLGRPYFEFLRVPAMSAGVYVLPAHGVDRQKPHSEDELYYIVRGRAKMKLANREFPVQSGTTIFVEANVEHRFFAIEEDLEVLVVFAPAESI